MTEFEFSEINPASTGNDITSSYTNINLLISCSMFPGVPISGSDYYIESGSEIYLVGVTIPTRWSGSAEGVNLAPTLAEVDTLRIPFPSAGSDYISVPIIDRQHKVGYYYLRTEKTLIRATGSSDLPSTTFPTAGPGSSISYYYIINGAEIIFTPFLPEQFSSYNYNPLINNSEQSRRSVVRQVVGRSEKQTEPTNIEAIRTQTAEAAQIQDSNYSKVGTIRGRYAGSVVTDGGVKGNDPGISVRAFTGSVHPSGSNIAAIKADTNLTFKSIYFNINKIPLHKYMTGNYLPNIDTSFPSPSGSLILTGSNYITSGSLLYEERGNNLARIVNSKVFARDRNIFFVTNEFGYVISEES